MTSDDIERRLRAVENELASLRGWRDAVQMRDDKSATWWPVGIAIVALLVSALLPLILGGAP